MNNYEAVYNDHLARIASEKGEGYANFIKGATTVLVGGDLIIETIQVEKRRYACELMGYIMGLAFTGLGKEFGIFGENNIIAAIKECRAILASVGTLPCEVH